MTKVFRYVAMILCIPLAILLWGNVAKVLDVFILHPDEHVFTRVALLENINKKYNDRATYRFTYQGQVIEGRDRAILFAAAGDQIGIYFSKKDPTQNGISRQLITLTIGQLLFFIVLLIYIIRSYAKTRS